MRAPLNLCFDRKRSTWTGRMKRGGVVVSALAAESPTRGQKTPAPALVAQIETAVRAALAGLDEHVGQVAPHFVEAYEQDWRGTSRRGPVSPAELGARFVLAEIRVHDPSSYTLLFRECSLFARHRPSITLTNGQISDARLERPVGKNGQLVGRFDMRLRCTSAMATSSAATRSKCSTSTTKFARTCSADRAKRCASLGAGVRRGRQAGLTRSDAFSLGQGSASGVQRRRSS